MSAEVAEVTLYHAYCAECSAGSESDENEDAALEWAANHDAECHEPDDGSDEAYEAWKESRYDD